MLHTIRCTKVKDVPNIESFKSYNPKKESCEKCKEDVWVTDPSRIAIQQLGKENTTLLCRECADGKIVNHLNKGSGAEVIHFNAVDNQITTIKTE